MSLLKSNAVQIGQSTTATQNFTLAVPSSPDGTISLARGNAGATTQTVLSVDASGNVSFPAGSSYAGIVNVKEFGATGNGVTDDTAAIQTAVNASAGKTLLFPQGVYIVTTVNIISNISITGAGTDLSIIKRKSSSPGTGSIFACDGKYDITINDITFDGNKANQTNGSNSVTFFNCYSWEVTGCRFINAKANSGYGAGVAAVNGQNDTLIYRSKIQDCFFDSNDGVGIYISKEWFIDVKGNFIKNCDAGISVLNFVFPPVADVQNFVVIDGNTVVNCARSGIGVGGYVEGGTVLNPIFGPNVPASREIIITNNNCKSNILYGIAYQGTNGVVSNNNCELNVFGGILFNAALSVCDSNTLNYNSSFAIDAGGCVGSVVSNNSIQLANGTGINVGAALFSTVIGNVISQAGTAQCGGISFSGIDGDGNTPFELLGAGVKIISNTVTLNNNVNSAGIGLSRLAAAATVENNFIRTLTDRFRAIIITTTNCKFSNNNVFDSGQFGVLYNSFLPTVGGVLVVPDEATDIIVNSAAGQATINNIYPYSEFVFLGRLRDIRMTDNGSGYTPGSHVAVTIAPPASGTQATATAEVSNSGRVMGVTVTDTGSGYTSIPSVTINGAGTAAAGTALIGCDNSVGQELRLAFSGVTTVVDGGNLKLNGNFVSTANLSTLTLRRCFGYWIEVSRFIG